MNVTVGQDVIHVETVSKETSVREFIRTKVDAGDREDREDPFYVVDLGRLLELHQQWRTALPSVQPFYAVKCNEDSALLQTLAGLGTGFDCASKNEIKAILDLGVSPDRIIYANPCKQASHLRFAAKKGVRLMTFDNELELHKTKKHFPSARLVLRIRADDPAAVCQLGLKFGCSLSDASSLLLTARDLGLEVVGVSFHVGSGCQTPSAYQMALELAAEVFQCGARLGFQFSLLDIGGGFPGHRDSQDMFGRVTGAILKGLEHSFSGYPNLRIIAEPGRYYACSTHALAVNVISKRVEDEPISPAPKPISPASSSASPSSKTFMYYLNDGVYGSFNCILFDHVTPTPAALETQPSHAPRYPTSLWGPTCDGLDKICDTVLAELSLGDWIYFDNMGAYTVSAASTFNGFLRPKAYYYTSEKNSEKLKQLYSYSTTQVIDATAQHQVFTVTATSMAQMDTAIQELVEVY